MIPGSAFTQLGLQVYAPSLALPSGSQLFFQEQIISGNTHPTLPRERCLKAEITAGEGPGGSQGEWGTVVGKGQTYTTKKDLEIEEFSGCWEVGSMGGEREN